MKTSCATSKSMQHLCLKGAVNAAMCAQDKHYVMMLKVVQTARKCSACISEKPLLLRVH